MLEKLKLIVPSDVYVDFVCLSWTVRHSNGPWVSFFAHGPYGMATAHAYHFLHVAVYVTMVTLFHQSIDNTVLISEVLRKPSSK